MRQLGARGQVKVKEVKGKRPAIALKFTKG